MAYGMAPVLTSGVLGVALLGGLVLGGGSMLQQMASGPEQRPVATATPSGDQTTDPGSQPTSTPTSTPGDPSATPTGAPSQDPGGEPSGDPTTVPTPGPSDPGEPGTGEPGSNPTPNPDPTRGHPGDPGDWNYNSDGDVIHLITQGDTLSKISAQYGVSVDQLAEYNGIRDVNLIYADSALRVPYLLIPRPDSVRNK